MKKRIVSIILACVLLCGLLPITASAAVIGDDYPSDLKSAALDAVVDQWNFYNRECTSFVAWRLNSQNGVAFTNWYGGVRWSHAKNWISVAQSLGITVNSTPAVGAVACSTAGTYGHVAWVAEVSGSNVTIEEYNYGNAGTYNCRTVAASTFQYIHIKDISVSSADPLPAVSTSQNITPGKYTLTNVGSGEMMNYDWGLNPPYNPINLMVKDGSPEQTFDIQYKGDGQYALMILHSDGGCVNVYQDENKSAVAGDKLTRWPSYAGETHHRFYFTQLSDGSYVIRPYSNTNLVVAATADKTVLTLSEYSESNTWLRWKLTSLDPTPTPTPSPEPTPEPSPEPVAEGNLEREPNDTIMTANAIATDAEIQGELSKSSDVDWYTFTLPRAGIVQLSFAHEYVNSSSNYWTTSFYTMDNQKIAAESWRGNATVTEYGTELGLPAGDYCIKIEKGLWHSEVPYCFAVNYTATQNWEKEPNNTPVTSTQITTDSVFHGCLIGSADVDWYSFELPESSTVSLSFSHGYVNSSYNYWNTSIYALENVNKVLKQVSWKGNATKSEQSDEIELPAGSYYLKIEKATWHSDESYSFLVNTVASQEQAGSDVHFPRVNTYFQDQFKDVPANQWYTGNVADAFELGLMVGNSATTFNPYGDVTIAEAITMASRIHSIYTSGSENFQTTGGKWYQVYMDYAYQNGIISVAYYNCDATQKATRAQFAEIFANALPDDALAAINSVKDNAIPDVRMADRYATFVYKLYRAGILAGSDVNGTFNPQTYITRAESAAIASRMAESGNRVSITLE